MTEVAKAPMIPTSNSSPYQSALRATLCVLLPPGVDCAVDISVQHLQLRCVPGCRHSGTPAHHGFGSSVCITILANRKHSTRSGYYGAPKTSRDRSNKVPDRRML